MDMMMDWTAGLLLLLLLLLLRVLLVLWRRRADLGQQLLSQLYIVINHPSVSKQSSGKTSGS